MIQQHPEQNSMVEHSCQADSGNVLIIDTVGKLGLAKWRLMSDQIPFDYLKSLPDLDQLKSMAPRVIILQLGIFYKLAEAIGQDVRFMHRHSVIVVGKKEEEKNLRDAFAKGAKAVFTLPLDLPRMSALCRKELEKIAGKKEMSCRGGEGSLCKKEKAENNTVAVNPQKVSKENKAIAERFILDTLSLGILCLDPEGRVILANKSFLKLINIEGIPIEGKNYTELFSSEVGQLKSVVSGLIKEVTKNDTKHPAVDICLPVRGEMSVPGSVAAEILRNEAGKKTGILITLSADKVFKEKEDMRVRSERLAAAGQLAAGAVHEIKNPLTSVRGFIQLLQKELEGNPKAEYIDIIISEIDRVNNIVNEFLKLAKPASPRRASCSLTELFEEIRIIMESEAFLKNVVIEERYSQMPPVKIDKEQIKQVLVNIIQNAFDAMPNGGRLTIHAEPLELEKKIKIDFKDTGFGISKDLLKKLFEPFFTTKEHGTGLGLSVSQQILESHGGHIEISSEEGKGTITTLYLPY